MKGREGYYFTRESLELLLTGSDGLQRLQRAPHSRHLFDLLLAFKHVTRPFLFVLNFAIRLCRADSRGIGTGLPLVGQCFFDLSGRCSGCGVVGTCVVKEQPICRVLGV